MKQRILIFIPFLILLGCEKSEEIQVYDSAPVTRKDIVVAVEAAGTIEPFLTVEVKSKASGEILSIVAETGDFIEEGTLLVQIDKRTPGNMLSQVRAELEASRARRSIAEAQSKRSETLFASRTINEVDYEQTLLEFANSKADVIRAQVAVENARIALDDTDVKSPMTGTVIEKLVEKGQVISSPTMDVGGGTSLMMMADLSSVRVKALVDETDIGKVKPDQPVTVTVTAYPNQPFSGVVSRIEPKALEEQTVTTFSVLIILKNESGLLRPGMNADVEISVAERRDVLAIPTIALKVDEDIPIASQLMGLTETEVRNQLSENSLDAKPQRDAVENDDFSYRFGRRYWVFVVDANGPVAVPVDTGLTDLDYSEVLAGLTEGEEVMMLPSSGLIRGQQRFQNQMKRFTSLPGMSKGTEKD